METSVKTLFVSALTAIVLSTSAFTSVAAEKDLNLSVSTEIDFNKVVITGNVHVELIQADKQKVVVVEKYDEALTTIKQKGDKLFIDSKEDSPISIVVYIKDLHRIDASNTVSVITRGQFSANVLQVFLNDNARAYVNGNIGSLYTLIKGHSELKLKGSSKEYVSVKGKSTKLKTGQFASLKTTVSSIEGSTSVKAYALDIPKDTVIAKDKNR